MSKREFNLSLGTYSDCCSW